MVPIAIGIAIGHFLLIEASKVKFGVTRMRIFVTGLNLKVNNLAFKEVPVEAVVAKKGTLTKPKDKLKQAQNSYSFKRIKAEDGCIPQK